MRRRTKIHPLLRGPTLPGLLLLGACASRPPPPREPLPAPPITAPAPSVLPVPNAPATPVNISPAEGAAHLVSDMNAPENRLLLPPTHNVAGARYIGRYTVCVDEAGRVRSAAVLESSGARAVDELWIEKMRNWRFRPWIRDGQQLAFCYPQRIEVSSEP